jgi:hypothetical protein
MGKRANFRLAVRQRRWIRYLLLAKSRLLISIRTIPADHHPCNRSAAATPSVASAIQFRVCGSECAEEDFLDRD